MPRNKSQEVDTASTKGPAAATSDGTASEGVQMARGGTGAEKRSETPTMEPQRLKPATPTPMIHIDEFLLSSKMRPEQKAGFRVYAGKLYGTEKGWKDKLAEYDDRKYRGGSTE